MKHYVAPTKRIQPLDNLPEEVWLTQALKGRLLAYYDCLCDLELLAAKLRAELPDHLDVCKEYDAAHQ